MKPTVACGGLIASLIVGSLAACSDATPGASPSMPQAGAGSMAGSAAAGASGMPGTSGSAAIAGASGSGVAGGGGGAGVSGAAGAAGTAATAGTAGAAGSGNPPVGAVPADYARGRSAGCGKPLPTGQEPRARFRTDIAVTQVDQAWLTEFNESEDEYEDRNYSVKVPLDYDPNKAYTLNIIGGGCGGDGQGYGGQAAWPDNDDSTVIHVHPNYKGGCYQDDGVNNPEEAFFDVWFPQVMERYCIDQERVFMTGYSSGAWNAITHGCSRAKLIRGHGQSVGGLRERHSECQGPVAAFFAVDVLDTTNPIHDVNEAMTCTGGEAEGCFRGKKICTGSNDVNGSGCVDEGSGLALKRALERNGCVGNATQPWGGKLADGNYRYVTFINDNLKPGDAVPQAKLDSVKAWFPVAADGKNTIPACVKYTGCPAAFPVVWCTTYDNGHGGKDKITTDRGDDMMGGYQRFFEQDVPRYAP
ncbi:MAG: glycosyl hydrolase family 62 protein [Polyangiaceae bacterium]|jgi:poly(3-hydroxybutyrate) depolymerase|nr:glycosyl hydrolase family 62 protein [Polyangiaceae bacterium]